MKKSIITGVISIIVYILLMYPGGDLIENITVKIIENYYNTPISDVPQKAIIYASSFLNLIVYVILFIILVLIYKKTIKKDLEELDSNYGFYMKKFLLFLVIFYLSSYVTNIIINIFKISTSTNQETIEAIASYNALSYLMLYVSAGIIGPVVEELVFRRAIYDVAVNKWVGLLLSTFLFGIIHVTTTDGSITDKIIVGIPYFVSGFVFGFTYLKSNRNITITIAIHAITNLISLLLMLIII